MGFGISELVQSSYKLLPIESFFGKTIAIDAFNVMYQFLYSIQIKGKPLMNRDGQVTSHLSGLFYKNIAFFKNRINPIYCFDGKDKVKKIRWSQDIKRVKVTVDMIESAKELLTYMGVNWIQAPSEGEAQCVHLCNKDEAWATASQDYDVLLFGGRRFIRNFLSSIKNSHIEFISSERFFENNKLSKEQLIDMSILMGNDFFPGIKSYGLKKSLKDIKEHGSIEHIFDLDLTLKNKYTCDSYDELYEQIQTVRNIFLEPNVTDDYDLKKLKPQYTKLREFLIEENQFSAGRIESSVKKLEDIKSKKIQSSLVDFGGFKDGD